MAEAQGTVRLKVQLAQLSASRFEAREAEVKFKKLAWPKHKSTTGIEGHLTVSTIDM